MNIVLLKKGEAKLSPKTTVETEPERFDEESTVNYNLSLNI